MVRSFWTLPHRVWNLHVCGKSCTWCYRFICCDVRETGQVFWISRRFAAIKCLSSFSHIELDDQGKDSTKKWKRYRKIYSVKCWLSWDWMLNNAVLFLLHKDLVDCVIYTECGLFSSCCVPFRLIRSKIKSKRSPNNAIAALAYNISNGRQAEYCTRAKKTKRSKDEKIK